MLKPSEIEIPEDNPFANDALSRQPTIELLTQLVQSIDEPFVLSVSSSWGTGKTTFLHMWQSFLKSKGVNTLYLNAWETDFAADPFLALVEELRSSLSQVKPKNRKTAANKSQKVRDAAALVAKRGIPILLRIATAGLLSIDEKSEEEIGKLLADLAEERIEEYEAQKKHIKGFQESLGEFVGSLSANDEHCPSLVFFIDELDRCRPNYALELLESLKHLFSTPGIVFVVAVDRDQLCSSIRAVYGSGFDAQGYLRRFFDHDFALPSPVDGRFSERLVDQLGLEEFLEDINSSRRANHVREERDVDHSLQILKDLLRDSGLSLREQIQTVTRLKIVLRTIPKNQWLHLKQLITMVFLREKDNETYLEFVRGKIDPIKVVSIFDEVLTDGLEKSSNGEVIEAYVLASGLEVGYESSLIQAYRNRAKEGSAPGSENLYRSADYAKRVLEIFDWLRKRDGNFEPGTGIKATVSRIAFSESFFRTP